MNTIQVLRQKARAGIRLATRISSLAFTDRKTAWWLVSSNLKRFVRPPAPVVPSAFDREMGVQTSGNVRIADLEVTGDNYLYATIYKASSPEAFREALERLQVPFAQYRFIDIGSGKGLVLMLAADYGFRGITGVEFGAELHKIAQKNIEIFRRQRPQSPPIESIWADAAEYDFPLEPLLLYFYEPFEAPVLRRVLANLSQSYRANPRPIVILYSDAPKSSVLYAEFEKRRILIEQIGWLSRSAAWSSEHFSVYLSPEAGAQ